MISQMTVKLVCGFICLLCQCRPIACSYNIIQLRSYGNVSFARNWTEYKNGFGHIHTDYWAGLDKIYHLTNTGYNVLKVSLQDWEGNNKNIRYDHFKLTDNVYYTLDIGNYSGDAGDSISYNNGMKFATYDNPDINNCAINQQGGWWFNYCTDAFLNGKYYIGGKYPPTGMFYNGIYWHTWRGYDYSLKFVRMILSTS